jgi:hypothetical protein
VEVGRAVEQLERVAQSCPDVGGQRVAPVRAVDGDDEDSAASLGEDCVRLIFGSHDHVPTGGREIQSPARFSPLDVSPGVAQITPYSLARDRIIAPPTAVRDRSAHSHTEEIRWFH